MTNQKLAQLFENEATYINQWADRDYEYALAKSLLRIANNIRAIPELVLKEVDDEA